MDDCVFCRIVKKKIPASLIFEDTLTLCFLDIAPVSEGHALVIPKEHAAHLHELSDEGSAALMRTIRKISAAMEKAFGCDFNILNNKGKGAGQSVFHVHFHLIPRRGQEGEFSFNWPSRPYPEGRAREILDRIRSSL